MKEYGYIFSVSGIRGIWGETLYPEDVFSIAYNFAKYVADTKKKKLFIARDGRVTGNAIKGIVSSAFLSAGFDVYDLGIVPTPTFLFNVRKEGASGGIMITASHNPVEWNGLKLVSNEGIFLNGKQIKELKEQIEKNKKLRLSALKTANIIKEDKEAIKRHIDAILESNIINIELIKSKRFYVVTDTVNASSSIALPMLLETLGCRVTSLFSEQTGIFGRLPEPLPENLSRLSEEVKIKGADIGMAIDPDGDRLSLVDNTGDAIGEEYTVPMSSLGIIDKINGFVINYSTSSLSEYIAEQHNLPVYRSPVGEANVVQKMIETGINFGGEGNGGVIYPDINPTRDSLVGAALILNAMAQKDKTLKDIKQELPKLVMIKKKYPLVNKEINFDKITNIINPISIEKEDGYRYVVKNGWLHVRKSNTEPVMRIIAEFDDKDEINMYLKKIEEVL